MPTALVYVAATLVTVWGFAHATPTRKVLEGFRPISVDNRRIILQEWLAEALQMWGIAAVVVSVTVTAGAGAAPQLESSGSKSVRLTVCAILLVSASLA
jgi:hypothetical protein